MVYRYWFFFSTKVYLWKTDIITILKKYGSENMEKAKMKVIILENGEKFEIPENFKPSAPVEYLMSAGGKVSYMYLNVINKKLIELEFQPFFFSNR